MSIISYKWEIFFSYVNAKNLLSWLLQLSSCHATSFCKTDVHFVSSYNSIVASGDKITSSLINGTNEDNPKFIIENDEKTNKI